MRPWGLAAFCAVLCALIPRISAGDSIARPLDAAVDRGVEFLLANQNSDGSWGHFSSDEARPAGALAGIDATSADKARPPAIHPDSNGGRTALVVYALMAAGQSAQSPALARAINFLRKNKSNETYPQALRALVYSQLPESGQQQYDLRQTFRYLVTSPALAGPSAGLYGYAPFAIGGGGDLSNSQYGVLGIWACGDAGLEISDLYWRRVENIWRKAQNPDGGWGYHPADGSSSATMTAAAVATLYITHDRLHADEAFSLTGNKSDAPTEAGLKWLGAHFSLAQDAPMLLYGLFGYERVGETSGMARFGAHAWFDEASDMLVRTQRADGSWVQSLGPCEETAYALLFLSRGRAPVAMQKLRYDGRWNNRPRDVANIIHWLRRQTERHVNWQVVDASASVAELREAPILYVSGSQALHLSEIEKRTLKDYVDEGGLVLAVNEGKTDEFARSIEQLAGEWYPSYSFADLAPDHAIFNENFPVKDCACRVRGLSNGARDLIVLLPEGDYSWQWQSMGIARGNPKHAFPLAGNLYCYATDHGNPRLKGEDAWVNADPSSFPAARVTVARLKYAGNWDPEPASWRRLANVMRNGTIGRDNGIELLTEAVSLDQQLPRLGCPLAHLTSTGTFSLSRLERDSLREYMDSGGVVLFDAAGGNIAAADSFEQIVQSIYPGAQFAPIPRDHELYAGGGDSTLAVIYRRGTTHGIDAHIPRLRGLSLGGRMVAISSPEDLSCALAGCTADHVMGYATDSATDLVERIIRWTARRPAPIDIARTD